MNKVYYGKNNNEVKGELLNTIKNGDDLTLIMSTGIIISLKATKHIWEYINSDLHFSDK